jgi:anti-sigma regulatory factor (Ser/Thr protein kinase)
MTMKSTATTGDHVELTFSPSTSLISTVRRFVSNFFDEVLTDEDAGSRMALAAHELLENACKYSTDGITTLRIEVLAEASGRDLGARNVRIRLSNRTSQLHIARLEERFEEMRLSADAFVYYQASLTRAAHSREGSGLGLARLWAEADMRLSCERDGDRVCLIADTAVRGRDQDEVTS